MGTLLLNSLEIRNFRGFSHLQVERLGRVNLIVGKNNVGKSSLLEALQLYARRGIPPLIWQFLRLRDELSYVPTGRNVDRPEEVEGLLLALKYLFYGRREVKENLEPIQIGPLNSQDDALFIAVGWYTEEVDEQGRLKRQHLQPNEYSTVDNPVPRFTITMGKQISIDYPLNPSPAIFSRLVPPELKEINNTFIGANGLSRTQAANLWDQITLRDIEADVLSALRIIAPGVEGQSFVGDPGPSTSGVGRIPIVRVTDINEPLPLGNLGNGMHRMLGISLALANARDGMLLIDEIENGLHYSVQQELWQLIFRLAHRLNVQVFATTHSGDCIEAFQKAAQENTQEEGMLIRLSLKKGEIGATLFDEEELGVATREQIEVR